MKRWKESLLGLLWLLAGAGPAAAFVEFPYDIDFDPQCWTRWVQLGPTVCPNGQEMGTEDVDWQNNWDPVAKTGFDAPPLFAGTLIPEAKYYHYGAGDGFTKMADGADTYIFGFSDITTVPPADTMMAADLRAEFPGPTFVGYEGQEVYLTLTNVGMKKRPDLFDPHTVHFHGFPNASPVFDGEPMASFGIRMMHDLTYYYNLSQPGTYLYHCHVEATEHMEMGMLANLYMRPRQDIYVMKNVPAGIEYPAGSGKRYTKFAYNDCDNVPELLEVVDPLTNTKDFVSNAVVLTGAMCGASGYDRDYVIQFSEFDPAFHEADEIAQPLSFAGMEGKYFMLNGRGYPDTVNVSNPLGILNNAGQKGGMDYYAQKIDSLIRANRGEKVLIRLTNLSVMSFTSIEVLGLPFRVIGANARLLRGPDGKDISYGASALLIGPGEAYDIVIDTTNATAGGTYFLYSRNLNQLNNNDMDRGGAMTEIRIAPAGSPLPPQP